MAVGLDNKQELDKILKHVGIDRRNLLQKAAYDVDQSLVILAGCVSVAGAYKEVHSEFGCGPLEKLAREGLLGIF